MCIRRETPHYPGEMLDNPTAKAALSAVAFHCYGETIPENQSYIKSLHPSVEIFFTECTESGDVTSFNGDFRWALHNLVIRTTRNWASTVLEWNLVLDGKGGPKISGGCENCRGLIDIVGWDENNLRYEKRPAFYALGHLSKFVAPGSKRIDSTQPDSNTKTVAMINPDDSALLIVLNNGSPSKSYNVKWFDLICPLDVPSWSAVTLFRTPGSNSVQVWATYDQGSAEALSRVNDISCTSTGPSPTSNPTVPPMQVPPQEPTSPPSDIPIASPSPTVGPTPSPTLGPTPAPVAPAPSPVSAPTNSVPTTGEACCSQNGINCVHENHHCELESKCGVTSAGCGYVFWLDGGVPIDSTICTGRYQGGCDTKACCPGLGCVSNVCSEILPRTPSVPTSPAPTAVPTATPVVPATPAPQSNPPTSDHPTTSPIAAPTDIPIAALTPSPTPMLVSTPAPVPSPTSGIVTTGEACCSQLGNTCLHGNHYCASESRCGFSNVGCGYVFWLSDGVPVDANSCTSRYQGGCNTNKVCCPGLECVGDGPGSCQLVSF